MLNRSYVNGHVIWYDNLEKVTWSPIMIESLVEEIGYEMEGRIRVFYCVPILTLGTNGVRAISNDEQTERMMQFLDIGHHCFRIYLDHDDSYNVNVSDDDVVNHPRANLPPVIIPASRVHIKAENAEFEFVRRAPAQPVAPNQVDVEEPDVVQSSQQMPEQEHEASSDSDDEDYDPGALVDSDNEIGVGDDDLYADNVDVDEPEHKEDRKSNDKVADKGKEKAKPNNLYKGKQIYNSDEDLCEGEDLWAHDSDDEELQLKF
ncbi:hypothetical protein D1007_06673 [Hordeum vulgare]|nr:hypothetical protein D1007_06673 [Hordeum vulgare]